MEFVFPVALESFIESYTHGVRIVVSPFSAKVALLTRSEWRLWLWLGHVRKQSANECQTMPTTSAAKPWIETAAVLSRRIESLANSDIDEQTFFCEFLGQLVRHFPARAAAVWMLDHQGVLSRLAAVDSQDKTHTDGSNVNPISVDVLIDVLQSGQAKIHARNAQTPNQFSTRGANLLVPLRLGQKVVGVVELGLSNGSSEADGPDQLGLLEELCVFAERYVQWRDEARSTTTSLAFWNKFHELAERLHRSLNPADVASVVVNDGRSLLGCDRVSLLAVHGRRCFLLDVSGQERINRRGNLAQSFGVLATAVIATGEPLQFTGRLDELSSPMKDAVTDFVRNSGSRMVRVIPLFAPVPLSREQKADSPDERKPIGALVFEQFTDGGMTPLAAERAELFASSVASSLHNSQRHSDIFLLRLWQVLGHTRKWFRGRRLAKLIAAIGLVAATILTMAYVPADYRVEGAGQLMPVNQREAFVPLDGEVVEVYVASGQEVAEGQPLVRIRNDEFNTLLLTTRNEVDEKRQLHQALMAQLDNIVRLTSRDEEIRLRGRIAQTKIEITGAKTRLESLEQQADLLVVRSPIAGTVATFQVRRLLMNRPVRRGEALMEIMDENGPWHLELEVAERRMGHLMEARRLSSDTGLTVEYVLATHPESEFQGRLQQVSTRSTVSKNHGTAVDVTVAVDAAHLPERRIGANVIAKIHCGRDRLAYVVFGDLIEFVQMYVW